MSKPISNPPRSRTLHVGQAWLGALAIAGLCASCSDQVVVGDALEPEAECEDCELIDGTTPDDTTPDGTTPDDTTPDDTTPVETSVPVEPEPPDCTDADAEARADYEAWSATSNSLAELAGSMFTGYVEGGPDLKLIIGRDQVATLVVGEPAAPPVKDAAYLCGDGDPLSGCSFSYDGGPLDGGTYPLHGASFADGRLTVEAQQAAAVDPWCALQDPVLVEPDCLYSLVENESTSWGPSGCTVGGEAVDCGWFAMAVNDFQPCSCTSTKCFGAIDRLERFVLDMRLEDDGHLEGSLIFRENARTAYLFPPAD